MVLIDALFINKGGGAVLLSYLMEQILELPEKDQFFFLLDPRFERPAALTGNFRVIPNKLKDRWTFYRDSKNQFTRVFCFANTPPPVKLKVPVYTYFHNQKLLEAPSRIFDRKYFRIYLKFLVTKLFNRNTDYYIVQTPHMVAELISSGLKNAEHCLQIPFYDDRKYRSGHRPFAERLKNEFVFISNPSPQKNHGTLLDAWEHLLKNGVKPRLHVTIDETGAALVARIGELNAKGADIVNHVYVDPRELYFNCPYLIFPSVVESFGLPLIEAADSGMKVIASDLPYVHDVVVPSLFFDPYDKLSIAAAVMKAMNEPLPESHVTTRNEADKLLSLLR